MLTSQLNSTYVEFMVFRQLRAMMLPVAIAGIVPALILWTTWPPPGPSWGLPAVLAWLPVACTLASWMVGITLLVATIGLFARVGQGTLNPWDPPRHLVVRGPYRYVRNPMISGVLFVQLGHAAAFGSVWLLAWFALFAAIQGPVIALWEEPQLVARFGDEYLTYRRHVRGWLPRLRPWQPNA